MRPIAPLTSMMIVVASLAVVVASQSQSESATVSGNTERVK
jgi:hypothetical protein